MCDNLYASTPPSGSGVRSRSFFGKNSDRHPAEPQTLCLIPRRPESNHIQAGSRTFHIKDVGFSFILSRPTWLWGGEMGVNEKGVSIGNEAVFSKFKPAKDGVLGMDILRAALGTSATAKDAVDFICCFTENNDQGGNGAYKGSLYYDNSYLVADAEGAYIVETAGRRWAWRAAGRKEAISNCYCITEDYKRLDTQTRKEIAPVNERAACSDEADPGRKGSKESFKATMEKPFKLRFSKAEQRRALSLSKLASFDPSAEGAKPLRSFLGILGEHGPFDPRSPGAHRMEAICCHGGGVANSATTASMAVDYLGPEQAVIWFTGSPRPCISLYKPLVLFHGCFIPLWKEYDYAEGSSAAQNYWEAWRGRFSSRAAADAAFDPAYAERKASAEADLAAAAFDAVAALNAAFKVKLAAAGDEPCSASVAELEKALGDIPSKVSGIVSKWEAECGL